jgi:hypothetical protein
LRVDGEDLGIVKNLAGRRLAMATGERNEREKDIDEVTCEHPESLPPRQRERKGD